MLVKYFCPSMSIVIMITILYFTLPLSYNIYKENDRNNKTGFLQADEQRI